MKKPHILYLIDILWGLGGAEGTLLRTVRLLPKGRYRCSIGTFRLRPGLSMLNDCPCPVLEFRLGRVFGAGALRTAMRLREFIHSQQVDIVHTFFPAADLWGGLVAKLSGCPVLVSSRRDMGILCSAKHRLAYRVMKSLFDQVQTVSSAVRDHVIRTEGLDPGRVVSIPNGIEIERIAAANGGPALRSSLDLEGAWPVVLTVGHIRRVKGMDVLIRAAARVCREHPAAMFLIAGSVHEPDYERELKELVKQLGLARNVRFLGKSDKVWSLLKLCDIFCLLSRSEGMSNALLEAMACSLPCVATAVGGTPEVIEDGRSGCLVPSGDDAAAADRILSLLSDPDRARTMGETARRVVEERFSAQQMIDRIVGMYDGLLRARRLA
jgi:glycosyltransferase involved in cell wall biosynthesis